MTHKNVYATTFPKILDPSETCKKTKEKYVTNLIGPDLQMLKLRFSFYRVAKVAKMDILKHILTFMLAPSSYRIM